MVHNLHLFCLCMEIKVKKYQIYQVYITIMVSRGSSLINHMTPIVSRGANQ